MLPILPADKSNHIIYGLIIFIISYFLLKIFRNRYNRVKAFLFVVSISIIKEIYDSQNLNMHTPEIYDAASTILGGLLGLIISFI